MKATIDLDEILYRRLKVEAARRGRTVRDLVTEAIRVVLSTPPQASTPDTRSSVDAWFGSLRAYASSTKEHDLGAMRDSIARGRKRPK